MSPYTHGSLSNQPEDPVSPFVNGSLSGPTQTRHPWRATARTVFAGALGLASLLPEVLAESHMDGTVVGAQALAVTGAVTRILALPGVDRWLTRFLPFLAAQPAPQPLTRPT